jgi:RNA-splicing ligase RtcB
MKEIKGQFNTAKLFATTVEESCEKQIFELCNQAWVKDSKIRIMADCHSGKGCVIGTTMTITDKIVPFLVGVDISCGVLITNFGKIDIDLKHFDEVFKRNIPTGKNSRQKSVVDISKDLEQLYCKDYIDFNQVNKSCGSLGGGNHAGELDVDDEGNVYLMIHTGSRNFGKRVAEFYQDKAVKYHEVKGLKSTKEIVNDLKTKGLQHTISTELAKRNVIANNDLCYLEGDLFDAYLNDMQICQKMATLNRTTIADILCRCMHITPISQFDTAHNYIDIPNKILRKGAISAQKDEIVAIPINMRDGVLICKGKGNADYNYSAPHGAGRLMSRNQARKVLSLSEFKDTMKGVYSSTVGEQTLDEAPDAYKPIGEILENIKDTVDVVKHIKPVYNIKAEE